MLLPSGWVLMAQATQLPVELMALLIQNKLLLDIATVIGHVEELTNYFSAHI